MSTLLTPRDAEFNRQQLLLDRDPHGNVQVAKIESERLLSLLCAAEMERRPGYKGKFEKLQFLEPTWKELDELQLSWGVILSRSKTS